MLATIGKVLTLTGVMVIVFILGLAAYAKCNEDQPQGGHHGS